MKLRSEQYVAVVADDMLAVQELHMAGDRESIFLTCAAKTVRPVVTSAFVQLRGNPKRAVLILCTQRKLPKGIRTILTKPVDMDTMDRILFNW